jgi:hypothetical protein
MTLFDLLFIVAFLTSAGFLLGILIAVVRGRRDPALRRLRVLAIGVACYMALVVLVSLVEPRDVVAAEADQCSDDWCIAVVHVNRTPVAGGTAYAVTFRLSSRARRISQRERFVVAYLRDGSGRRYDADASAGQVPFDVLLGPSESLLTTRTFEVPTGVARVGVVVARQGGAFPRCCIIGQGPFYKWPITWLD